jgi:uncharacterized protein
LTNRSGGRYKGRSFLHGRSRTQKNLTVKAEGSYLFRAPQQRLWQAILDPKIIAKCIPGCEALKEIGPDCYRAVMKTAGVTGGRYNGQIQITDKKPFSHCVLNGKGGGAPGFINGEVVIDLQEINGQTLLKFSTDAKLSGFMSTIGKAVIGVVVERMANQFFKNMERFL